MKITIDTEGTVLTTEERGATRNYGLFTKDAFEVLSRQWLRVGWSLRQFLTFSWLGLPVLQLPEDLLRLQEVIHGVKPDVIVETGVYRGGSLLYLATLCKAMDRGRVIGVDVTIPGDVRSAIEDHVLASWITLIEGDSASPEVADRVRRQIGESDSVLVILDSDHRKEHVLAELRLYARLVTAGSYIIATDGIMKDLADVPGGHAEWATDHPLAAASEFAAQEPDFEQVQPPWLFRGSELTENVTYWPGGWLRRVR